MYKELLEVAGAHAARLEEDIKLCRTRDEHLRVTARANEALDVFNRLKAASGDKLLTNND
jgi:hypothetical protein